MATHLTLTEREIIARLLTQGQSKRAIARCLGGHPSTTYRKRKRNNAQRGCGPKQAQQLAETRRQACRRACKRAYPESNRYVPQQLATYWSPD